MMFHRWYGSFHFQSTLPVGGATAVWALAIPRSVLKITNEIDAWQQKNGAAAASPYQSESFGGYSYSMRAQSGESGAGWKDAFAGRLSDWRKL